MALRPSFTLKRIIGNFFVLFVLLVISFIYYTTVFIAYDSVWYEPKSMAFLVIFHCLCFMLLWCLTQAIITDPGQVPKYWGFMVGDSEQKRRRYCLMCHVFKPERCHHCSACNRCVLNMDHHCPWINNCVGFYNRKFFILLLFYVLVSTYLLNITLFTPVLDTLTTMYNTGAWPQHSGLLLGYCINLALSVVLSFFSKFHLKLLFENKTTIEMLDKKNIHQGNFNCGTLFNWMQVFGRNPWLWLLPITGKSGKPLGDGVVWRQPHNLSVSPVARESNEDGRSLSVLHQEIPSPGVLQPHKAQQSIFTDLKVPFNSPATDMRRKRVV